MFYIPRGLWMQSVLKWFYDGRLFPQIVKPLPRLFSIIFRQRKVCIISRRLALKLMKLRYHWGKNGSRLLTNSLYSFFFNLSEGFFKHFNTFFNILFAFNRHCYVLGFFFQIALKILIFLWHNFSLLKNKVFKHTQGCKTYQREEL